MTLSGECGFHIGPRTPPPVLLWVECLPRSDNFDDRMTLEQRLASTYAAFNARDIERVLDQMTEDVDWPNAWEGGRVVGHDAVRDYWTRQWAEIDPEVQPQSFRTLPDGRIEVTVHQLVRTPDGSVASDGTVLHTYTFRDGQVARMDVSEPAGSE